ncbi:alpha-D-ribose 1-methylphosphonate 5-triphosphate diphosphatase [Marinibacterium sp. SX1]|uniref:alpha-D-ribose 1-methylphosphonate 5-triphosphate diphosphatase n=1 Tax=Marinibacterium sp. SX1 TaxID=3388424 RepID=UPI003D17E522
MFDATDAPEYRLTDARIVTGDDVIHGSVTVAEGRIVAIGAPDAPGLPMGGDYLIPGLVDLHTDHVETHVFPRNGVVWAPAPSLAAHDGVVVAGGVTTVFDSLCVGAAMGGEARRALLAPLMEALERGRAGGQYRAEHLVHLRCEICDPETEALVRQVIGQPSVRLVSVMDHTPGDRQCLDVDAWVQESARDMKISVQESRALTEALIERSGRVGPGVRQAVIAEARARDIPVMSHDDRTVAHVDEALAEGVMVSEFPTTLEAARRAREVGQAVLMGAPNYVRGGSQSGNVAVRELLDHGLVDVLASDYVPGSLLSASFAMAEDAELGLSLPEAIAMVSRRPARIVGLDDRGEIAEGLRADMVRVRRAEGHGHVGAVWREGRRVF